MIHLLQAYSGEAVSLRSIPERVVSLVPSITENLILFGKKPVGRTSFCIHPKDEVRGIPVVGGTKTLKMSKILELNPDLVIANKEENLKEDVEFLVKEGVSVWVTYPTKVQDVIPLMESLEGLCGTCEKTSTTIQDCKKTMERLIHKENKKKPRVVALIWKNPWMAAGKDTYIDNMLTFAGGQNPVKEEKGRYPVLTQEEILALSPDLILLPSEPYAFKESDKVEWFERLAASNHQGEVELFCGEDLSWYGPRVKRGLETLEKLISALRR